MQFAKNANLKSQFVTSKYKDKLDIPIWNFKSRTCGDCLMIHTAWWALISEKKKVPELSQKQKEMTKDDYVIVCGDFGGVYVHDYLNDYLEEIRQSVKFKKWFFGHYHDNRNVNGEEILIYEQIVRIA